MNKISAFILDLFFPNRCPVCGEIISFDSFVCGRCMEKLEDITVKKNDICQKCGKADCICKSDILIARTIAGFFYEKEARDGIISLKAGSKNFGYFLGDVLAEKIKVDDILKNADNIVPVPMSRKRLRERGYNQSYVIAAEISHKTGIPVLNNALFKNDSAVQHELSREERKNNVSAFMGGNMDLSGKKIIVCDDVLTTGSTLNKCAELLINMGAAQVFGAVGTTTKLKKE